MEKMNTESKEMLYFGLRSEMRKFLKDSISNYKELTENCPDFKDLKYEDYISKMNKFGFEDDLPCKMLDKISCAYYRMVYIHGKDVFGIHDRDADMISYWASELGFMAHAHDLGDDTDALGFAKEILAKL